MKKILFFFLFSFCFSKITYSQNWNTFTKDTSYYYAPANSNIGGNSIYGNYIRCVFIDSVSVNNNDSTFYFYKTIGLEPFFFNDIKKSYGRKCWIGKQVVKKYNNDEEYTNILNEILLFKPNANLWDTWTICQDSNGVVFHGQITNKYDSLINGTLDSIKEFTITTDSNGTNINHYYNNYKFLISKNNGWIHVCQLNLFPYYINYGLNVIAKNIPLIHKKISSNIVHKNLNYIDSTIFRHG